VGEIVIVLGRSPAHPGQTTIGLPAGLANELLPACSINDSVREHPSKPSAFRLKGSVMNRNEKRASGARFC
jgi:hypothetical protein